MPQTGRGVQGPEDMRCPVRWCGSAPVVVRTARRANDARGVLKAGERPDKGPCAALQELRTGRGAHGCR